MNTIINQWLEVLSSAISTNIWLAPFLALIAGILTYVTSCALTSVPLVIGYVGGIGQKDTKRAFWLSVVFSVGMAATFTVLGTAASLLGKLMQGTGSWWYIFLGILMLLMALYRHGRYLTLSHPPMLLVKILSVVLQVRFLLES